MKRINDQLDQRVRTALDVSRKVNDKATIVLSRCNPVKNAQFLLLSPTDTDHLRMIGNLGAEEKRIFEHAVYRVWPAGVSKFEEFEDYGQGKSFLTENFEQNSGKIKKLKGRSQEKMSGSGK